MKKRTLCLILSALMLLASLAAAGCTQTDAPATAGTDNPAAEVPKTGEKITVILPRHEMDTIGFHEEKTRQFEAETGIEVELINMGGSGRRPSDRRSDCGRRFLRRHRVR